MDTETPATQESLKSRRALAQYIGVNCPPNICATVQLIAPGNSDVEEKQYKLLKKSVEHLKKTSDFGPNFIRLEVDSGRAVALSDA